MSRQSLNISLIRQWVLEKADTSVVEQNLLTLGFDDDTRVAYLSEFIKAKNSRRQQAGFIYVGVGAFLGFASCVLSLTNPFPEIYNLILFGLTSISILVIFLGLYKIFE